MDAEARLTLQTLRLIVDNENSGSWNLAVDDMLLESISTPHSGILRFYQWDPATLSLGYFQSSGQRESHQPSAQLNYLRRGTGGGAVIHDHELTYILIFPTDSLPVNQISSVYVLVHQCLIEALHMLGAEDVIIASQAVQNPTPHAFLCFQRRNPGDVIIQGHKIAGSAQRRRHNHVLQHGSVLLGQSSYGPELPGIHELTQLQLTAQELQHAWLHTLERHLNIQCISEPITHTEKVAVKQIQQDKYLSDQWNEKR